MSSLIDPADADNTASFSGAWTNPSTWTAGVPAAGQVVHIPNGVRVVIGAVDSQIQHLLVDGELVFSRLNDTTLQLDTLEVGLTGYLEIGTETSPIPPQTQVSLLFDAANDVDVAWDDKLLSRGLIADGRVSIHGTRKTVHLRTETPPLAGETVLILSEPPLGWQVGDQIVLTGTKYAGWKWDNDIRAVRYFGTEDEVRIIAAIDGERITLDSPLAFDHLTPREDLRPAIANFSRNVHLATAQGELAEVHRRGHVMFRHATHFDVRYAAFHHLGRTDKSVPSFALDQLTNIQADSNVRGRYAMHFHMTGIDSPREPAIAIGNAVFKSPGWGFVHHASNALFHNNASFDTFGAGFVAETGDEIGSWTHNIAIRAEGNSAFNPKNGNDRESFDMGRTGDGFWFQGRMVRAGGNVAASVNHGYVYLHRGTRMRSFPADAFQLPEALPRHRDVAPDDAPIRNFHANEAFASTVGLYVVKANPNQGHDIHSELSEFLAWEVRGGAALEYTSHYLLTDFDVIGATPQPFMQADFGIDFGNNSSDMTVNRARIADVPVGIGLGKHFTDDSVLPQANQYVVINSHFENVPQPFGDLDESVDRILASVPQSGAIDLVLNGNAVLEYNSPATTAGTGLYYFGEKTDGVGPTPVPAGTDTLGVGSQDMIELLAREGYYRNADGAPYAIVEEYFTDRATGQVQKFGLPVRLGPDVEAQLGNPFSAWADAFEAGSINLNSSPPSAADNRVTTTPNTPVLIDVLSNDWDIDGEPLRVDGVVQPHFGTVFVSANQRLEYRPDPDFQGTTHFRYWASDGQGNFAPATVTVDVESGYIFADRFQP
jgi:hypothetical protein